MIKLNKQNAWALLFISGLAISYQTFASDHESFNETCQPQTYVFGEKSLTRPAIDKRTGKCFSEAPKGLQGSDLADFSHLSEGADVYPYEWFMSLKSMTFKDDDNKNTKPFHAEMNTRLGLIKSQDRYSFKIVNGKKMRIKYLMPYVGLTASWSTQRTDEKLIQQTGDLSHSADAYESYENSSGIMVKESQIVKDVVGVDGRTYKSIRMVGTNCALCHTSQVTYTTNRHFTPEFDIQGGPAMVNVRGFFKDMIGSTIVMFVKGKNLELFLKDIKMKNPSLAHINPAADAKEIKSHFCSTLAKESQSFGKIGQLAIAATKACFPSMTITLLKGKKGNTERIFNSQAAIKSTYRLLLDKTYGFKSTDNIGHLDQRLKFLAFLSGGTNPAIMETASAYNRTDAFGRISNLVLRTDFPVDLTAPVSLPWIWGLKYMGNLHYNGNSNSVILRNVGQALGLGAMITSENLDSTINVHNLDRLENLVHKIKVPEWKDVFSKVLDKSDPQTYLSEFEIDMNQDRLVRGFDIYKKECQYCHESNKFVGPSGILREYKMFPLTSKDGANSPNTDSLAALNAIVPVQMVKDGKVVSVPFEEKIFNDVSGIKARYYQQYNVSKEQTEIMEFKSIRGNEFFRDTYLGSEDNKKGNTYGKIVKGNGYKAKHLSGVWATAPYLHNGSVPNMMVLLTKDTDRPAFFNVKSNNFDPINLGFKDWERDDDAPCEKSEEMLCFDTKQVDPNTGKGMGNSNQGHNWGTNLSHDEKMDLINFLKYLPPEPEYAWDSQNQY